VQSVQRVPKCPHPLVDKRNESLPVSGQLIGGLEGLKGSIGLLFNRERLINESADLLVERGGSNAVIWLKAFL
jgi:hypothetical protein